MPKSDRAVVDLFSSFLRLLHIEFHNSCTSFQSHQERIRVPFPHAPSSICCQLFSSFLPFWLEYDEISVVLICISVITEDDEQFLEIFLRQFTSSFGNSLFSFQPHPTPPFLMGYLFCFVLDSLLFELFVYSEYWSSVTWIARKDCFPFCGLSLTWLMVSSAVQKFLSFMKPHLSIVGFNCWVNWVLFRKPFPTLMLYRSLPMKYTRPCLKNKSSRLPYIHTHSDSSKCIQCFFFF